MQVVASCTGFDVVATSRLVVALKRFVADGEVVRALLHRRVEMEFTNTSTQSSVRGFGASTEIIDVDDNRAQSSGLNIVIPVAGQGAGAITVGVVRTEDNVVVFQHGQNDTTLSLCTVLA